MHSLKKTFFDEKQYIMGCFLVSGGKLLVKYVV